MLCRGLLLRDPEAPLGRRRSRALARRRSDARRAGRRARARPPPCGPYRFGKTEATTGHGARAGARQALGRRAQGRRARAGRALARAGAARLQPRARAARHPGQRRASATTRGCCGSWSRWRPTCRRSGAARPSAATRCWRPRARPRTATTRRSGWLDSLYGDDVLATYAANGPRRARQHRPPLARRVDRLRARCGRRRARAEEAWRTQPRDVGGGEASSAVSFDDLAFVATRQADGAAAARASTARCCSR